jgi:hypothetical protein
MAHNPTVTVVSTALGLMASSLMLGMGWSKPAIGQVTFEPPPGQDRPEQTAGGGSRGEGACWVNAADRDRFLMLSSNTTASSHPTFEVQVPATTQQTSMTAVATREAIAPAATAEFNLFDENGVLIYEAEYSLPQEQTVVHIELPDDQPGLTVGQDYFWIFAVVCDPSSRLMDTSISGMMTRTDREMN